MALELKVIMDAKGVVKSAKVVNTELKKVGKTAKKQTTIMSRSFDSAKKSILSYKIGLIAAGTAAVVVGAKLFALGNKAQGLENAFKNLTSAASLNADVMLKEMTKATAGTVTQMDLMQQANTALLLGLPVTEKTMGELANAGRRLGKAMGIDALKGLESLTVGIGRQSKLWLDNLGIIVDTEKSYKTFAKTLGKTKDELTDAEKKTAFFNTTMESVRAKMKLLGKDQLTVAERFKQIGTFAKQGAIEIATAINEIGVVSLEKDLELIENKIAGIELQATKTADLRKKASEAQLTVQQEQFKQVNAFLGGLRNIFSTEDDINRIKKEQNIEGETSLEILKETRDALVSVINEQKNVSTGIVQNANKRRESQIEFLRFSKLTKNEFSEIGFFAEKFPPLLKEAYINEQLAADAAKEWKRNQSDTADEAQRTKDNLFGAALGLADIIRMSKEGRNIKFSSILGFASTIAAFVPGGQGVSAGLLGASQISRAAGFAQGGSFRVGGSGGTDSQLVAFRASPNETVDIKTPSQQATTNNNNQKFNINVTANSFDESFVRYDLIPLMNKLKDEDRVFAT